MQEEARAANADQCLLQSGDDGAAMAFGYRGSPCWIDLSFDTTEDFHEYGIDWRADRLGRSCLCRQRMSMLRQLRLSPR